MGDGLIDAAMGAIQRAAGVEARLVSFNVSSGDRRVRRARATSSCSSTSTAGG